MASGSDSSPASTTTIVASRSPASFSAPIAAVMPEPMMQMSLSTTRRATAQRPSARGGGRRVDSSSGRQLLRPMRAP